MPVDQSQLAMWKMSADFVVGNKACFTSDDKSDRQKSPNFFVRVTSFDSCELHKTVVFLYFMLRQKHKLLQHVFPEQVSTSIICHVENCNS